MSDLTAALQRHHLVNTIQCCVCDQEWEERGVGTSLRLDNHVSFGELCPRCLNGAPGQAAERLRRRAEEIRAEAQRPQGAWKELPPLEYTSLFNYLTRLREESYQISQRLADNLVAAANISDWSGRVIHEMQELRKRTKELIELSRSNRGLASEQAKTRNLTSRVANSAAQLLVGLSMHCPKQDRWQTTVADMIDAEAECFVNLYPELRGFRVRQAIEGRYQQFLAASESSPL
jgi:hypothetical protein